MQSTRSRPDPAEKFKSLDSDGSSTLDKTELSDLAKELYKMTGKTLDVDASITTYDSDGDGALSEEETGMMMREVLGPPPGGGPQGADPEARFAELDSDGSGGLSLEELEAMAAGAPEGAQSLDVTEALSKYDSDGDGELNSEEMAAMMKDLGPPPSSTETSTERAATEQAATFTARQASEAYLANSGEDSLARLMDLLEQLQSATSGSEKS
jgi:Ca2+-binding EF-hand superfamily protein